ncbi:MULTISPECIES: patatin-like phospholipase family protein [Ramlibacter]|uniref:Patatin-like phospholipase family protein n=1 Tax=Ramlibacter aquaticus TaxID=2780094 RepID=A0ABR9SJP0_9BURK|nr:MULTISPECIES: patatin-like phospholipase family protein [Ramlibacter]MBE7941987.1 patatin-like phospholipase family protein [Ramlibacter aquaticus]
MTTTPPATRIALALAGGGPLGAIYEIGALCALQEALDGLALERLDHYVGVSAGGFLAAALANGLTPRALCASFIENRPEPGDEFDPAWLLVPAWGEFGRRALRLPAALADAAWQGAVRRRPVAQALQALGPALPVGLFSNEAVEKRLATLFSRHGRSNDFRRLRTRLTLVATDLDTGEAAPFGAPGWDTVPISRAVQATSALPGLFPPVAIGGRHYVDGALKKTMHASVALEDGARLLICLNPLVPFDARAMAGGRPVAEGGLPAVLNQTFRTLIHSRMELGMKQYERLYPGADILLVEPHRADPEMYSANPLGYGQRRHLAEHAYQQTRHLLYARRAELGPLLARHGIVLREDVLARPRRLMAASRPRQLAGALERLSDTLDDLDALVAAKAG